MKKIKYLIMLPVFICLSSMSYAQFTCGDVLIDTRDGQSYTTAQIGSQCWMTNNLNIGTMVTSVDAGSGSHTELADNSVIEKFCYDNLVVNCDNKGGMYTWDELMQYDTTEGIQGICPDGWRLPTRSDWDTLINQFSTATVGEDLQIGGSSGFEADLPGRKQGVGSFIYLDEWGFYSSSSQVDSQSIYFVMYNYTQTFFWVSDNKNKFYGFAVRCIGDAATGILKNKNGRAEADLMVYPNPAHDVINIHYSINLNGGPRVIMVFDILGNVIAEFEVSDDSGIIELSTQDLSSGIYYYSMVSNEQVMTAKKIIVVK